MMVKIEHLSWPELCRVVASTSSRIESARQQFKQPPQKLLHSIPPPEWLVRVGRNPDSCLLGEVCELVGLLARRRDIAAMRQSRTAAWLFAVAAEMNEESGAGGTRLAEGGGRGLGNLDGAV